MSILINNNDELEYTAGNNKYRFYKSEQDDVDEENKDKYTEYQVVCIFTSGKDKPKCYAKKYRDDEAGRDVFFSNLKSGNDNIDFTDWEQC